MSLPRPLNWLREPPPPPPPAISTIRTSTPSADGAGEGQFQTPIVKVFGDNGMVVIGNAVKEWVIMVLEDRLRDENPSLWSVERPQSQDYENMPLETLVGLLNVSAVDTASQQLGASLSFFNTNEYVGWNIPNFYPTEEERLEMDS